ncbi:MAG: serine/threonine-protein phosphatase [Moorea sp. SIO2B7]|nr:serine/threonine-protein phosphatase [Moorena sp. SIO2B7]
MAHSAAKIQCSNPHCQTHNSKDLELCKKCGTPIVKRYLWVIGEGIAAYQVGKLIDERYFLKHQRLVLDTKPARMPQIPDEIPQSIRPYLQLFPYRLHIPQVFGQLTPPPNQPESEIWLLEYATVSHNSSGEFEQGQLLPPLTKVWQEANPLRQLNWLWQIAGLWQPLKTKGVASSLLNPSLLRVNGSIIQLLELQTDDDETPSLKHLGQLWSEWVVNSSPSITEFLQKLCLRLEQEQITNPDQLIAILDQGLKHCGHSDLRTYQIFSSTDTGMSREHNEDACYPPSGQLVTPQPEEKALAIVCDGIGGQDCGEIASQIAIDSLQKGVENLSLDLEQWNPIQTSLELERVIDVANDLISKRNDSEQRYERQRMGTTVVMTLNHAHEMYFGYVGDSRIYWVTPTGCHQVTVDDDLASREVRLGYALYRDAIQYPTAGALIQALGMSASVNLRPTVQRLILDEDCVFLLCSDGLSDFDRVEQYWESEILPILQGKTDVAKVGKKLIKIANQKNGHDNVTVALVHCKVQRRELTDKVVLSWDEIESSVPVLPNQAIAEEFEEKSSQITMQYLEEEKPRSPLTLLLALLIFLVLGVGGTLLYFFFPEEISHQWHELKARFLSYPSAPTSVNSSPDLVLDKGDVIKIQEDITIRVKIKDSLNIEEDHKFPEGSIIKILQKESVSSEETLKVLICQYSTPEVITEELEGEITVKDIESKKIEKITAPNNGNCFLAQPNDSKP